MANGRKLYRKYMEYLGKDCAEFVELESDWDHYKIHYKDSNGKLHIDYICHKEMMDWIIRVMPNSALDMFKNIKK